MFVAMSSESVDIPAQIQESRIVTLQEKNNLTKSKHWENNWIIFIGYTYYCRIQQNQRRKGISMLGCEAFLFTTCLLDTEIPT